MSAVKTIQKPKLLAFVRKSADSDGRCYNVDSIDALCELFDCGVIKNNGTDKVFIPALINGFYLDAKSYAQTLNSIVMCYYDGNDLVEDEIRTNKVKSLLFALSPRVMGVGALNWKCHGIYEKNVSPGSIRYEPIMEGNPVKMCISSDYVLTKEAAVCYASLLGICTKAEFDRLEISGKIRPFMLDVKGRRRMNHIYRGAKLYLLDEIHSLHRIG